MTVWSALAINFHGKGEAEEIGNQQKPCDVITWMAGVLRLV